MSTVTIPKYITGSLDKILASNEADNTFAKATDTGDFLIRKSGAWDIYSFEHSNGAGGHGSNNLFGVIVDAPISSHLDASQLSTMTDTFGVPLNNNVTESVHLGNTVKHVHDSNVVSYVAGDTNYTKKVTYMPHLFNGVGGIHFPDGTWLQQDTKQPSENSDFQTIFVVFEMSTYYDQSTPVSPDIGIYNTSEYMKDPNRTEYDAQSSGGGTQKIIEGSDTGISNGANKEFALHLHSSGPVTWNGDDKMIHWYGYGLRNYTTTNSADAWTSQTFNVLRNASLDQLGKIKSKFTEKFVYCFRLAGFDYDKHEYRAKTSSQGLYNHGMVSKHSIYGSYYERDQYTQRITNPTIGAILGGNYVNLAEFIVIEDYISDTDEATITQGLCNKWDIPYLG